MRNIHASISFRVSSSAITGPRLRVRTTFGRVLVVKWEASSARRAADIDDGVMLTCLRLSQPLRTRRGERRGGENLNFGRGQLAGKMATDRTVCPAVPGPMGA